MSDTSSSKSFGSLFRDPGAEQDRHESHFALPTDDPIKSVASKLGSMKFGGSGAEQDRHASHFELGENNPIKNAASRFNSARSKGVDKTNLTGSEQDVYGSHFLNSYNPLDPTTVGIFRSTLLPSIGFHSGLAVIAYAACRATNRVDGKDWLWPSAQVLNAWWCAVGSRVVSDNVSIGTAYSHLPYTEKLLLAGVSVWGARLLYRTVTRTLNRQTDDPRYELAKKEEGFWNKALLSMFLPEALFQAVISLPLTLPFRALDASAYASPLHVHPEYTHGIAVALFSAGMALEVLADSQLAIHKGANTNNANREGVWSIVRHPNYLGDMLIHASFPLLLWSAGIMHPLALLGPVANYVFLHYAGDAAELEGAEEQQYVKEQKKNSMFPSTQELNNPWVWTVAGYGLVGLALEKGFRKYILG